ncbi:MAG TPA: efflux RND transporter periplasmic adaptor subunit, partial [Chromatiales bacterium]|nr:efflux RND transporter periplasmic adaptor subunit [Chromatiales bacterium]
MNSVASIPLPPAGATPPVNGLERGTDRMIEALGRYACLSRYRLPGILLLALVVAGCEKPSRATRGGPGVVPVQVVTAERSPLQADRIVTGSLQAVTWVRLFNEEPGRIIELPYQPGDAVEAGTLLVRIDDRLIRAELNKANANLKQAKVDLRRLRTLSQKQLASQDELARAETALILAQAEVNLLQTRLDHTRIKAPFAGIISERFFEPGDVVSLHSHILSLIDPRRLKVVVRISELLLANLEPGEVVQVRVDALGEQYYPATVARVFPTIDPRTRKGYLEARLQDLPPGARPGQLSRVRIHTESTPRLNVPFAAIRYDSRGEYVYRIGADDTAHQVRIRTGIHLGNRIEVIEGLAEGDRVIVKGFIGLRDGSQVKPVAATEEPAPKTSTGNATFSGLPDGHAQRAVAPPWHSQGRPLHRRAWPHGNPPEGSTPGIPAHGEP